MKKARAVHMICRTRSFIEVKSEQSVDEIGQSGPVVEARNFVNVDIRLHALVNVIESSVFRERHSQGRGNLEDSSVCCADGLNDTAAAGGCFAKQRDLVGVFEHGRDEIAAGETHRGNQTVEVFIGDGILLVIDMIQIDIGAVERR